MKIGSLMKDALILFAITVILGVALSAAKVATNDAIVKAQEEAKVKAYSEVCPGYVKSEGDDLTEEMKNEISAEKPRVNAAKDANGKLVDGIIHAKNAAGEEIGYIVQAVSKGFGGDLNIVVGFDNEGHIIGVKYVKTPQETPGLGMKTTNEKFLKPWSANKNISYENIDDVYKDKSLGVDAVTSATISSNGFKDAVKVSCDIVKKAMVSGR